MKPLRFEWLLLLAFAPGFAGTVLAETPTTNVARADVPTSWLLVPEKALVLEVRHENLRPECRRPAAELFQAILQELLASGTTLYFSRAMVTTEAEYYRTNLTNEVSQSTVENLLRSLDESLKKGALDWQRLHELHVKAPDSETVSRNLPWLSPGVDVRQIRMAGEAQAGLPVLELNFRWSSRAMRGIVLSSNARTHKADVFSGKGQAWKVDAELRLRQGETNRVTRTYSAPDWEARYYDMVSRPLAVTTRLILHDLKAGLTPPPAPPELKSRKTKKGR
jgi:hypothetical protein